MVKIDESTKEMSAVYIMELMLSDYAKKHSISFDEAMKLFVFSNTYKVLFDYETGVWKEGPNYILGLFENEMGNK